MPLTPAPCRAPCFALPRPAARVGRYRPQQGAWAVEAMPGSRRMEDARANCTTGPTRRQHARDYHVAPPIRAGSKPHRLAACLYRHGIRFRVVHRPPIRSPRRAPHAARLRVALQEEGELPIVTAGNYPYLAARQVTVPSVWPGTPRQSRPVSAPGHSS